MLQRHKKELLELKKGKAGRGLSKKVLAAKETEMKERHEKELAALTGGAHDGEEDGKASVRTASRLPLAPDPGKTRPALDERKME